MQNFKNIKISKKEILRYLGYRGQNLDSVTDQLIDSCIVEIRDIATPKYHYSIFSLEKKFANNQIFFKNSILTIESKSLYHHLEKADKAVIMAATLGISVDRRIRYYNQVSLEKSVIFDACATTYIEAICDSGEKEIKNIAKREGFNITFRFSPGYGDLAISVQPSIIKVLDANRKLGLTCSESFLLIPTKSVTAIIGFTHKEENLTPEQKLFWENAPSECKKCKNYHHCIYLREGTYCEFRRKNL
ncbi:MAG: methionine synthase [Promethearchaeota archaeon]